MNINNFNFEENLNIGINSIISTFNNLQEKYKNIINELNNKRIK